MADYARLYSGYGFERHKGYATAAHLDALSRLRPSSLHRVSRRSGEQAGWKGCFNFGPICGRRVSRLRTRPVLFDDNAKRQLSHFAGRFPRDPFGRRSQPTIQFSGYAKQYRKSKKRYGQNLAGEM
jgi:hypothetical protein